MGLGRDPWPPMATHGLSTKDRVSRAPLASRGRVGVVVHQKGSRSTPVWATGPALPALPAALAFAMRVFARRRLLANPGNGLSISPSDRPRRADWPALQPWWVIRCSIRSPFISRRCCSRPQLAILVLQVMLSCARPSSFVAAVRGRAASATVTAVLVPNDSADRDRRVYRGRVYPYATVKHGALPTVQHTPTMGSGKSPHGCCSGQ